MDKAAERLAEAIAPAREGGDLRRLRRRRRRVVGADEALPRPLRRRGRDLHSRPHLRGLRPQSGGDARTGRPRRDADRHRRLRHQQRRCRSTRRARPAPMSSCSTTTRSAGRCRRRSPSSIRTATTTCRGRGISARRAWCSWRWCRRPRVLRTSGPMPTQPDLLSMLDLVALATVCDVVPLTGVNRAFVVKGLLAVAAAEECRAHRAGPRLAHRRAGRHLPPRLPDRPAHQCRRAHRRRGARQPAAGDRRSGRGRRRSPRRSTG